MEHTVKHYMDTGMDRRTAEYYAAGRKRILCVTANDDFTLAIRFDNGEERLFNVRPLIKPGTVFEVLSDPKVFHRVYIDPTHCVAWDIDPSIDSENVWNNRINLCPDSCYLDSVPVNQNSSIVYANDQSPQIGVVEIVSIDGYDILFRFNTGEIKSFNFESMLNFPAFAPLREYSVFTKVYLEYGVPTWCDGEIDISPDTLYAKGTLAQR